MNDFRRDSFYLNEMAVLTKSTEDYSIYTVLPEYGEGGFTIFKVIPGFKLGFNDFFVGEKIINQIPKYQMFSEPILKINYCLKGKMLSYNDKGKVCASNKGSTAYYAGIENIHTVEHFDKHYESIALFGYFEKIIDIFEEIFQVKRSAFSGFNELINREKEFVVLKSDARVICILNEIKEAFKNNENDSVRLKAIELLLYELKNFEKNKKRKEVYYNRYTVDRIIEVEKYIRNNLDEKITINKLSDEFNISFDTLKRCFKQMFSTSIYAYIKKTRMEKAKELLESSDKGITEISLICGYSNHHSFSKAFKEHYKIAPREIRRWPPLL